MVKSAMVFSQNLSHFPYGNLPTEICEKSPRSGLAELEFRDVQALAWRNVISEILNDQEKWVNYDEVR